MQLYDEEFTGSLKSSIVLIRDRGSGLRRYI
jgi:hypothetical protein